MGMMEKNAVRGSTYSSRFAKGIHISLLSALLPISAIQFSFAKTYRVSNNGNTGYSSLSYFDTVSIRGGDSILFQGGATFTGTLNLGQDDGGTATNPIIIRSYGAGRATINGGSGTGIAAVNCGGIEIRNINVMGGADNSAQGIQFWVNLPGDPVIEHIVVDSVEISNFGKVGLDLGAWPSRETGKAYWGGYSNVRITHVSAHHNGLSDSKSAGIQMFGHWPPVVGKRNHRKVYVGHSVTHNNKRNGIALSSVDSAMIEYCEAYENVGEGGVGIWYWESDNSIIQHSISHSNVTTNNSDGGGFDLDGGCRNCIMQYNYSYNNDGAGYLLAQFPGASPISGNIVRYNISQNDARKHYAGIYFWSGDSKPIESTFVYNNTIYVSKTGVKSGTPACVGLLSGPMKSNQFANNIFIATDGAKLINIGSSTNQFTFKSNAYWSGTNSVSINWGGTSYSSVDAWSKATGQEKNGSLYVGYYGNPGLTTMGQAPTLTNPAALSTMTGYKLTSSSPLVDKGLSIQNLFGISAGSTDFWGTSLANNQPSDIGANEYNKNTVMVNRKTTPILPIRATKVLHVDLSGRLIETVTPRDGNTTDLSTGTTIQKNVIPALP